MDSRSYDNVSASTAELTEHQTGSRCSQPPVDRLAVGVLLADQVGGSFVVDILRRKLKTIWRWVCLVHDFIARLSD